MQSLYTLSVKAVAKSAKQMNLKQLEPNVQQDLYIYLLKKNRRKNTKVVARELNDLDNFAYVQTVQKTKDCHLHKIFQKVIDAGIPLAQQMTETYETKCENLVKSIINDSNTTEEEVLKHVQIGLQLALFLSDAGWSLEAQDVYSHCYKFIEIQNKLPLVDMIGLKTCCGLRLAHMLTENHSFQQSNTLLNQLTKFMKDSNTLLHSKEFMEAIAHDCNNTCNMSQLFNEYSLLFQATGEYGKAQRYSALAFKKMTMDFSPRVQLDIIKQGASMCLLRNELTEAKELLEYALELVRRTYGDLQPITVEVLEKYGQYLIKNDQVFLASKILHYTLMKACQLWGNEKYPEKAVYNIRIATLKQEKARALLHHPIGRKNVGLDGSDLVKDAASQLIRYFDDHSRVVEVTILEVLLRLMGQSEVLKINISGREIEKMENCLQWALAKSQRVFGQEHLVTAECHHARGELSRFHSMFQREFRTDSFRRAVSIKEKVLEKDDISIILSKSGLQRARLSIGWLPPPEQKGRIRGAPIDSESWRKEWLDQHHSTSGLLLGKYSSSHTHMGERLQNLVTFYWITDGFHKEQQVNRNLDHWDFVTRANLSQEQSAFKDFVLKLNGKQTLTLQQLQEKYLKNNMY